MQKRCKKIFSFILTLAVLIAGIPVTGAYTQAAEGDASQKEYEIYPVPRSVNYEDEAMTIQDTANLVFESTIDSATTERLNGILDSKGVKGTVSGGMVSGAFNILVGTKGSGGAVEQWFDANVTYDAGLFDKADAYTLAIRDDVIAVLGKDTDAAFYGLSTLKMIMDQTEGKSVRKLLIEDYASGQYRGFIEGYYGIPWSVEDRISLMRFGGDFKMNIYIFAPKDDPYHNTQWRTPYPDEKLAEIEEMVAAGAESKCRFAWAIHPFMNDAITLNDYEAGLEAIQTKFEQLYEAGVRQFVISADDANSPVTLQARLCEDMTEWVKAHEGTYNLVFVPQVYCTSALTWSNWGWTGTPTVEQYFGHFSDIEDLELMWTGEWVCHPASQNTITNFKNKTGGKEAFMWLNWPVNDVNHSRLVMGPAERGILEPGLADFKGLVTNPLEQAEASKTSLFAIADFAWNTTDFSCFESWEDGFRYIEPGAPEAMHELCKHLTNPTPGGITSMGESTELTPYITAFTDAYDNGNGTDFEEEADALIAQFEKLAKAADDFQKNGVNANLQDEMKPWVDSLRYLSKACIGFIRTAKALRDNDEEGVCGNYLQAVNAYKASQNCEAPQLNGSLMVEAGAVRIMPFAQTISGSVKERAMETFHNSFGVGEASGEQSLIYSGLGGFHQGSAAEITDGDDETFAWFNTSVGAGGYIGLDLGDVYKLDQIRILQGTSPTNGDIFSSGILEYSKDNENWTTIDTYSVNDIEVNVLDQSLEARYVRLRTPSDTGKWYAIREFSVTTRPLDSFVYTNVEAYKEYRTNVEKTNASVLEIADEITLKEGEFIGLELPCAREITSLNLDYTNGDKLEAECSYNAFEWIPAAPSDARYIRIINKGSQDVAFRLTELSVEYTEENRTIFSIPKGKDGYESAKAGDNSLMTAFAAAEGSGSLIWRMQGQPVDELYILQDLDTISNAKVSVHTNTKVWKEVGTLNKSRNVFDLRTYGFVNEVKISWEQNGPTIYEMYAKAGEHTSVELLQTAVEFAKSQGGEGFTKESYAVFAEALAAAEKALQNPGITEEEAAKTLENLYRIAAELKEAPPEPEEPDKNPDENNPPSVKDPVTTNPDPVKPDPTNPAPALTKGYTETVKDLKYKVTNADKKEAVVCGVKSKKLKKITVPATVKLKNITCSVTGIAGKAFSGMRNLQTVTIGKNVKEIGSKAFFKDRKLKRIVIKGKVLKKLAKDAFKNASKKGTIQVPKAKKSAYAKLFRKATKMKVK